MELLQSVITNSYLSIETLIKFWITQLIDIIVNLLMAFPINVAICVFIVIIIVYFIFNRFFVDQIQDIVA